MPTANKGLEQPANGSNVDSWDGPVNGNFGIIDKAFGGVYSLNLTGATAPTNISASDAQNLIFNLSGLLVQNVTLTLPLVPLTSNIVGGQWIVNNATSNAFTVTIARISGAGTSVVVPQGAITTIYSDGTNIRIANSTSDRFPVGAIVMWSGTIATIPTGWRLCNGSSGTPDLRNKFIIGASVDDAGVAKTTITGNGTPTISGGSKDAILVEHDHTATIEQAGLHSHEYFPFGTGIGTAFGTAETFQESQPARITASAGAHTHPATISTEGEEGTDKNLPPYYALAYIIRTAY